MERRKVTFGTGATTEAFELTLGAMEADLESEYGVDFPKNRVN